MLRQLGFTILAATALTACGGGDPLRVTRSACPAVAIVQHTGDVTLFSPPASRDASAIDVVATMTNVRGACSETGSHISTGATFTVLAQRTNAAGARQVTLPYFVAVVQAGDKLVTKQTGTVTLNFPEGQVRAQGQGSANAQVDRAAATLSAEMRERITRKRKPGDADAAVDPLSDPEVRDAVRASTFEVLVGFQLDEAGLAYNVTK
ncbi:hypothetical protein ACFOMD_12675 [Sphingoaurantiacus capsulatus]|uniref:Lipoprotein n=1 Tax=Sphingoaurantiacus capsulatus TaxID=1771310 RepID=A0ABV7XDU6_9SPHN